MNLNAYQHLLTTDISDAQTLGFAMDIGIKSLLSPAVKIMGPAYTVRCPHKSNTYLHDAIYTAPKGAIIVAQADRPDYALAGGNVCKVAQMNGVAGMVIDGVVRDLGEIREANFPVYARGVYPKPGFKSPEGASQVPIICGGVVVNTGDLVAADEEGIVVVPKAEIEAVLKSALEKEAKASARSVEDWRAAHIKKINAITGNVLNKG